MTLAYTALQVHLYSPRLQRINL